LAAQLIVTVKLVPPITPYPIWNLVTIFENECIVCTLYECVLWPNPYLKAVSFHAIH